MARQKGPFDAVQFTRESAERVARVVRDAETAPPAASVLVFDKRFQERVPRQVRAATFSGSWAINASKVVTFKNAPTATASVTNLSWPITSTAYSSENCIVGKDGTSWYLVAPVLQVATAAIVAATQQQTYCSGVSLQSVVSGISLSASLNTSNCSITIGQTVTTSSVRVVTSTATAAFISSMSTAAFLRVRVP